MWQNIIWDVDGTLFDTYPSFVRSFHGALQDLGLSLEMSELLALAKVSVEHCTRTLSERFGVPAAEISEGFKRHYGLITAVDQILFPGVAEICRHVAETGGKNVIVTHRGRASTDELLEAHGLARYFSGAITADDGFPRKPDPAAFHAALEQFSLDPAQTLNIGDREIDVQAGQAAGLYSCLFAPLPPPYTAAQLVVSDYEQFLQTQFAGVKHLP